MHTLRVFFTIIKHSYRAGFEYPGSFIGGVVAQWISYGISMVMLFLMVWNFGSLAGWEPIEVIFMYAVWLLSYALGASFTFNMCNAFPQMAIRGTLDEAYTRPMPPFLYVMATHFNIAYISHIILTGAALAFSIGQLGITWTVGQWLWFALIIVCGAVIIACMMLICDMPAIRTRSQSPTGLFFWQMREFTQYPITIYPRAILIAFTSILPFGFVNFYPIQVLLGKEDGIFPRVTMWLSPAVAVLLVGVTALCWRILSSKYESAGT
ncbi:MAG: ABC-2 family transporter protein [Defluviitaleaceae bacterium]|nr:ABC-2 family transporter protein [Defluviitaleaceae bacterium]